MNQALHICQTQTMKKLNAWLQVPFPPFPLNPKSRFSSRPISPGYDGGWMPCSSLASSEQDARPQCAAKAELRASGVRRILRRPGFLLVFFLYPHLSSKAVFCISENFAPWVCCRWIFTYQTSTADENPIGAAEGGWSACSNRALKVRLRPWAYSVWEKTPEVGRVSFFCSALHFGACLFCFYGPYTGSGPLPLWR